MIVITHKNFKVGLKHNYTDSYFRIRIRNCNFNYYLCKIGVIFTEV